MMFLRIICLCASISLLTNCKRIEPYSWHPSLLLTQEQPLPTLERDEALAMLYNNHLAEQTLHHIPHYPRPHSHSLFSYENAHKILNGATMGYCIYKIFLLYRAHYDTAPHQIQSGENGLSASIAHSIKQWLLYFCPQFLQNLGIHSQFLIESLSIMIKALIFKTVIKFMLICGQGDIFDVVGHIVQRCLRGIATILLC